MQNLSESFHVAIHDVTPQLREPITAILNELQPLVQHRLSAAVVPCWHGEPLTPAASGFAAWVNNNFDDVLLHGWSHCRERGAGLLTWLTGRADEFSGLSPAEAVNRLRRGQAVLTGVFGKPATGWVPPAWQHGALTRQLLLRSGLLYRVGLSELEWAHGAVVPLSTWSWDAGLIGPLGYVGEAFGQVAFNFRAQSMPCLIFHPADVRRNLVKRGVDLIRRFLAEGRQPVRLKDVLADRKKPVMK